MAELVAASGEYLRQILADTHPIWHDGLDADRYQQFWAAQLLTPWGRAHLDRVALLEGDQVRSSAKRYDLSARIDGRIRRVLGIGALFTDPAYRGRGEGGRLLNALLDAAEAEGYEYAMLFSEIDPRFYERFDFVPLPLVESRLTVTLKGGAPAMLVRAGDDRDLPAIAEIAARQTGAMRFSLDRSEDFIRFGITKRRLLAGLGPPGLRDVEFLVAEEGHQAVAYVVMMIHGGRWFLEDVGDRDPSGARVGAMLQVMLARTPHLPQPPISGWLPPGLQPPQITIVESAPTGDVLMIRSLTDRTLPLPPLDATQLAFCRLDYF